MYEYLPDCYVNMDHVLRIDINLSEGYLAKIWLMNKKDYPAIYIDSKMAVEDLSRFLEQNSEDGAPNV
tara:strand:- start:242 stop:445 length:204 start_codon:yes stop_codon:yes gene_type:complete